MNYEIVEIITDLAGKYRARIIVDDQTQETMFFKFDHYPSQEEVNEVISQYKDQINNGRTDDQNM